MSSTLHQSTGAAPHTVRGVPTPRWLRHPQLPAYAAIALGIFVRAAHVLSADFPLNDGGLFYRMTEEIQAAHYHLPAFTSYNNESIPFAYSPLGFYLAAAINSLTGISLLQLFRFLPLFVACLTVVAFYRLARTLLGDERTAAAAVLAFALLPRSFVWLVMGGGLTRSLGYLFALIALEQAYRLYTEREWRYAATTTVACALAVLSHLGMASFLILSIVLLFLFYGRHRHGVLSSAVVAAGTILLTAPWWGTVIAQHGLAPFQAAGSVNGSVFSDVETRYTALLRLARFNTDIGGEPLFPLVSILAFLGSLVSLRPGRLILPVWWVMITALDVRGGPAYAPIPTALLAGIGIVGVLVPALRSAYRTAGSARRVEPRLVPAATDRRVGVARLLGFVPALVLAFLLVYGVATSLRRNEDYGGEVRALRALTPADRDAMRWVAEHTPPGSRFLVVTGQGWAIDKVSEWFPALTHGSSVSTIQGAEWLPGFKRRLKDNDERLQSRCGRADGRCLDAWADSTGHSFSYVYVAKQPRADGGCCAPLITALRRDPDYALRYDGKAAFIVQRR